MASRIQHWQSQTLAQFNLAWLTDGKDRLE